MLKQELTVNFKKDIFIGTQTCNQDICETEMLGLDDTHLARKWVTPNSGKDCQACMKRILASMRLICATFWWASRIRVDIWEWCMSEY